ncbi:MAG: hypothetical protein ACM3NV_00625 [Syntrophothermus sp.]
MRGLAVRALALVAAAAAALGGGDVATEAGAAESRGPLNLEVAGLRVESGSGWSADREFAVAWDLASGSAQPLQQATSIGYRLADEAGRALSSGELQLGRRRMSALIPPGPRGAPPAPGSYRLSLWTQGGGVEGVAETVLLRFDNGRPSVVSPIVPEGWIRAGDDVEVRLQHPGAPRPLSGIRGYAVELGHGGETGPCAGPDRCSAEETDLGGGEADDSIVLGPLLEGVNVVKAVAVSGTGMRSAAIGTAALRVDGSPPEVAFAGAPAGWSSRPVQVAATAADRLSGMDAAGPAGPATWIAVDGRPPTLTAGPRTSAIVHGDGLHEVLGFARDAVGNVGGDAATIRIDETEPRVAFESVRDPADPERIVAVVADALSGPSRDRGSIAIRPLGTMLPFQPLPTEVTGGRLIAHWASDAYPPGVYELRATGFDVAGNRAETGRRADGAAMVLSNPVKAGTALAVGFGGSRFVAHRCRRGPHGLRCRNRTIAALALRPATTTVGYGRGVPLAGRLTTATGVPVAGEPVEVTEVFDSGAEPSWRTTTVETGADGSFAARLAPGPSRRVAVAFAGTRTLAAGRGRDLRVGVRAAVSLRASTPMARVGGAPVVFGGRVGGKGAAVPPTGLAVELEFRVAGLPWSEFRTVQTDAAGAFRLAYAFSDDDSRGVRFQFRAHVRPQPGLPYDEASSPPVAVIGR